jgi:hypothetical protein
VIEPARLAREKIPGNCVLWFNVQLRQDRAWSVKLVVLFLPAHTTLQYLCTPAPSPAFCQTRPVPSPRAPHGKQKLLCLVLVEELASRSLCSLKLILLYPLSAFMIFVALLVWLQMSATLTRAAWYVVLYSASCVYSSTSVRVHHIRSKASQLTSLMRLLRESRSLLFPQAFQERYVVSLILGFGAVNLTFTLAAWCKPFF